MLWNAGIQQSTGERRWFNRACSRLTALFRIGALAPSSTTTRWLASRQSDNTGGNSCMALNVGTGLTAENNVCSNVHLGLYLNNGGTVQLKAMDHNNPYTSSYVGSDNTGNYYGTLSNWQGCTSHGCPTVHDMNSTSGNPELTGSYHLTNKTSAAWQTGANLSSICNGQPNPGLGALCIDKAGVTRQQTGSWDIGAYEDSAAGTPPTPPTKLAAVVQ